MQQLQIKRLTQSESNRERAKFDPCIGDRGIPDQATIKQITKLLGKTDRTIARYRKLLLRSCLEYQSITVINGIDSTVLVHRQIELLIEFSELMTAYKNVNIAIDIYGKNHPNPNNEKG